LNGEAAAPLPVHPLAAALLVAMGDPPASP
jgi:hypothetical protein